MTTTITQFTGGHNGSGGAPGDRVDTVAIGGTAAAGDWLQYATVGGADGSGLSPSVVSDNVSGTTGWVLDFDNTTGTGPDRIRSMGWSKLCVGGETTVTATWPGAANHAGIGFWAHTLTQPTLYLIDSGVASFDVGTGTMRFQPGAGLIQTNAETYVGGMLVARGGFSFAQFVNPPTTEGGVGTAISGAVGALAHYNHDETGTTADVLIYELQPVQDSYGFWYGFTSGGADVPGASSGGLLLGDATATVTTPDVSVASAGGLMLGDATPSVLGGDVPGEAHGGLARGRTKALVITPFPPVPNTPPMTGSLGCGIYDVFIFNRGLGTIVGRIPFNQVDWSRVLDDTSQAQVVVNGVSDVGPMRSCCELLGSITPYEHEIGIYRTGYRVWSGPVVDVKYPSEQVQIYAEDLSHWLKIRWLHYNHNDVQQDLANIWSRYVEDAMSVDNTAGLHAVVQALTGVLADRLYTQDMGTFAADAIAELARTGLDWACVDRRMTGGPVPIQPSAYPDAPKIPTLTDESFRSAPEVDRSGDLMGNSWFVGGSGQGPGGSAIIGVYGPEWLGAPGFPDHVHRAAAPDYSTIEQKYGVIERRVNETKILDQLSIDQNAATRYDLTKLPVDVISSGTLLPSAGIDIRQLIPGSVQNIHLARACVKIGAPYRLKSLAVSAKSDGSEDVTGGWEPLGSEAAHEDL